MKDNREVFKSGLSEFSYNKDSTGTVKILVYWGEEKRNASSMEVPFEDLINFFEENEAG
jgi:hypothetical protein